MKTVTEENEEKIQEASIFITKLIEHIGKQNFIVAGGAIRDMLNGKPINDFDFFINSREVLSKIKEWVKNTKQPRAKGDDQVLQFFHQELRDNIVNINLEKAKSTKYSAPEIDFVIKVTGRTCKFDFIFVNRTDLITYINNVFDFGLCKAFFSPEKMEVVVTPEYITDVENKTLTIDLNKFGNHHNYMIGKAMLNHLPRILKKYPDFTVNVITQTLEEEIPF